MSGENADGGANQGDTTPPVISAPMTASKQWKHGKAALRYRQ